MNIVNISIFPGYCKMVQKAKVRLIRDGIVIYTGELASLQIVEIKRTL